MPPRGESVCSCQSTFPTDDMCYCRQIGKLLGQNFHILGPQILRVKGLQNSDLISQIPLTS